MATSKLAQSPGEEADLVKLTRLSQMPSCGRQICRHFLRQQDVLSWWKHEPAAREGVCGVVEVKERASRLG